MKLIPLALSVLIFATPSALSLAQQMKYPPLSAFLMAPDAEIALAKSAAPSAISDRATIKLLTKTGYEVTRQGDNGFVCLVMRGFTGAPTFTPVPLRALAYDPGTVAPICLNPPAARTVLPYYELRTHLALQGKTPEQIAESVKRAYETGDLPKRNEVSFAYMWSAAQKLGPAGHWHPHIMVYAPGYDNAMMGNNPPGSHLPTVSDDEGTPFAVIVIPVDDQLAIKPQP